ncbi:MAG: hypothetical protein PVJ27_02285 [Candidatus Brocadiaceae bacterium]|jgi:hypothetical protein
MSEFDTEVECPRCGAVFAVARIRVGREETCPVCRSAVRVTGAPAEAQPEPEAEVASPEPAPRPRPRAWPGEVAEGERLIVCCASEGGADVVPAAAAVAGVLDLEEREARRRVRRGMGILAGGVGPTAAQSLLGALRDRGVEAFAIPAAAAATEVGPPLPLCRVYGADEDSLHVQVDQAGTVRLVDWGAVVAGICVRANYAAREVTEYRERAGLGRLLTYGRMGTFRGISRGRWRTKREDPEPRISLALRRPQGGMCRLVFGQRQVRYGYLGGRLQASVDENLVEFLSDLVRWASRAFLPESLREASRGRLYALPRISGRTEHENYLRWAVCCAVARNADTDD